MYKARCKVAPPDIALFAIGLNGSRFTDTKNGDYLVSPENFKKNVKEIISLKKKHKFKLAFIGVTPVEESKVNPLPWHTTEYYKNKNCKLFNNIIKSACLEGNIPFLNIFEMWRKLDYENLLHDGAHPNTAGHKLLYKQISEFLKVNNII